MENEAHSAWAYLLWDAPCLPPWVNDANACLHLQPLVSESLAPGASAAIRGRVGISTEGLEEIWGRYGELCGTSSN